jgi:vanillate monooxygenase ferredoxin subunit
MASLKILESVMLNDSSATPLLNVRVARKAVEAQDVCSFELVSADAKELPSFDAGAHIDVYVPGGGVRQYSLCNAPGETHRYVIAVLRDANSRGGSAGMHDRVAEGDTLRISVPKNHFALAASNGRSILLAGGIGVTPLLAMAERLATCGADFTMHYCTRSQPRTAFVERIAASPFSARVRFHHDDGEASQKIDLQTCLAPSDASTHLYVCGPAGFLDFVLDTARKLGWADHQIHFEYFGASPRRIDGDSPFDVMVRSTGQMIHVGETQTVVAALAEHGIDVPVSCEQGVCGTCLTRVVEGEPEHRDLYLSDKERAANDQFLPCCSRSKSRCLVLDL